MQYPRGQAALAITLVVAAISAALSGCSNSAGPTPDAGEAPCQTDAECSSGLICRERRCVPPGLLMDSGVLVAPDAGVIDGGEPASDGGSVDAGVDAGPTLAPYGAACAVDADCESGVCLTTAVGARCSAPCSDACPIAYDACQRVARPGVAETSLCVPFESLYCKVCERSADCPGTGDRCADIGGATYCARGCNADDECPTGYACRDIPFSQTAEGRARPDGGEGVADGGMSVDDGGLPMDASMPSDAGASLPGDAGTATDAGPEPTVRVCWPAAGACPGCIDKDGDRYGAGLACPGRDCNDDDASVHPGAPELCDGFDNNCDGRIDEGFDFLNDDNHCGRCGLVCDTASGRKCCEGQCVDTYTSAAHCGGCGRTCAGEGAACCFGDCRDTRVDVDHCSGCGLSCLNEHGERRCVESRCAPLCSPGFGDCDLDPRNGCEQPLNVDAHCGACGQTCSNANGTTRCGADGICAPTCEPGYGDCDGVPRNGCETDTRLSAQHCGGCAQPCLAVGGTTACESSRCTPACDPGLGDCDGVPRNGCETDLAVTTAHCGGCSAPCTNAHGATRCEGGLCTPTCEPSFADCDRNARNGCETDTRTTLAHCGACNQSCSNAHGATACSAGACAPTCDPGFADCDRNTRNGCETELASTAQHCGACDRACTNGHGAARCVSGRCAPTCDPGWGDCDGDPQNGCETDLSATVQHCGACGIVCSNAHGMTQCLGGVCKPTCEPSFYDCDGDPRNGCEANITVVDTCNACRADSECPQGFYCGGQVCVRKRALGSDCGDQRECQSGFCADRVCCQTDCAGACRSCRLTGSRGQCRFVPGGQDPRNECEAEAASTCGRDGYCDGAGACRLQSSGTECAAQGCSGAAQTNSRQCDGAGLCGEANPPTTSCAPYTCDTGGCRSSCTVDAHCQAGFACVGGTCKVAGGLVCTRPADCASGYCVDGVCCNEPCSGRCERCDQSGRIGQCAAVPAGQDPDGECDAQEPSTCGRTGTCSGARGACALYAAGTSCATATCASGVETRARSCDGTGTCLTPTPATLTCAPFVCNANGQSCLASCANDAQCESGFSCAQGVCKKSQSAACLQDADCATGFCTDGVCCDARCGGLCEKCTLAGRVGQCTAVAAGQDPDNECGGESPSTCGQTGFCDGARGCARFSSGTVCAAAFCAGTMSHRADLCDGSGACVDGGTQDCMPFTCNGVTGACRVTCSSSLDCIAGFECTAGACKRSLGASCGGDAECASGFCTDGVCCQARCGGTCERCNLTFREGFCDAEPAGQDPDNECTADPVATCGQTGACSGARSCGLYASGTLCAAASCEGGLSRNARQCNGAGACLDQGSRACAPFACDPLSGVCRTQCLADGDCQAGYACAGGACKKALGQSCSTNVECAGGFCADNVCCNARCSGVCEKCNAAGRVGFCDPVTAGTDPDLECTQDNPNTCGQNGFCSGQRSCQLYASGTVCRSGSCVGTVSNPPDSCDGRGRCIDSGTVNCAPYTCDVDSGLCQITCSASLPCESGFDCVDGLCRRSLGATCQSDGECGSGFCVDGVCCGSRCDGVCEKCNLPGRAGLCDPVPSGDDPEDECEASAPASCGQSGTCNGARACAFHANGTLCRAAACSGQISSLADTCDGAGACVDRGTRDCAPYVCDSATGACRSGCQGAADCLSGYECSAGQCRLARGSACTSDAQCATGYCADGVCCESRCGGTCEKCNQSGRAGFCDAVPTAQDPDEECAADPVATCGRTGACSGTRSCALFASGTECAATMCTGDVSSLGSACNGVGSCVSRGTESCAPLRCDAATGTCKRSCASAVDCQAGHDCVSGQCKRSRGAACQQDSECSSGFCTDGVCCDARCAGTCEKCTLPGRAGYCDPVPAAQDPDNECASDPAQSCGRTGGCSGARACALWPAGTVCAAAACIGNTATLADTCDGQGVCVNQGTRDCAPYRCNNVTSACRTSCAIASDCVPGNDCQSGQCKKVQGETCASASECASGFCADGVCCESSCAGTCERCNQPARAGFCDPIAAGQDPDDECAPEAASTCGRTGACDGQRGCALQSAGAQCRAPSCNAGVADLADTCDGQGRCVDRGTQACAPYACDPGTSGCRAACAVNADCQAGFACAAGVCKREQGQACIADGECATGFCTDGVCCAARCAGLCEKCNLAGRAGLCDPVAAGADPDNDCAQDPASSCQQNGACDGQRACALYAAGTVCRAPFCVGNTLSRADTCDGLGACVDRGEAPCTPFVCDPLAAACKTSCAAPTDCPSGYACLDGDCKKAAGAACGADGECATGFCTDGVCCDARCAGTCEKCDQAGRVGTCDPVPAGQDPNDECAPEAASSCGRTGSCSGMRACALFASGTVCAPASCNGLSSNRADTCDGVGRCVDQGTQLCSPLVCDATSGECKTTCAANADCQSGYECQGGACRKARGTSCASDGECATGFCADGVCCSSRCGGTCEKCNLAGRAGFCDPVPAEQDPDDECPTAPASTCGMSGLCSGARTCALYPSGAVCAAATCTGPTTSKLADTCNGSGTCQSGGTESCAPFACLAATGRCATTCTTAADCQPNFDCGAGGVCKKARAQTCVADAECASGFCTDGVCCAARCSGLCEACNQVGRAGFCDPIAAGQDPADECPVDAASTCGRTGVCDGARACQRHADGTVCGPAFCTGGSSSSARTCDGVGVCRTATLRACNPYACDTTSGECRTTCAVQADCQAGSSCVGGLCKTATGQGCAADGDCASGFCTDGVCCNARCGGSCEKCTLPGRVGSCDPVPAGQDPDNECVADDASTCMRSGECNGARACALHASGTVCAPPYCVADVAHAVATCDGLGRCAPGATSNCTPYVCDPAGVVCRTGCATNADCGAGWECSGAVCRKSQGNGCAADGECASGFCTDGVCCASRCSGTCEKCNQAGRAGFCDAVPAGQDPSDECAADAVSTCGRTGTCNGARACGLYAQGTACTQPFCSGNTSTLANTCNGAGACVGQGTRDCAPYLCGATSGVCATTCSGNAECTNGFLCLGGACKKPRGTTCAADTECESGFCTDGVCCDGRCGGTCEKCNLPGRTGFCDAIAAGADPDDECAATAASTCGTTGTCSGQRACALHASGAVCVSASCAGQVSTLASTCNGAGACLAGGAQTCNPYACNAVTGLCRSSCESSGDCAAGSVCASGFCVSPLGQACGTDADCQSGFCTDGVCCDGRCGGTCEKCNQSGRAGFCDPIAAGADPEDECLEDAPQSCGQTGLCNGARACAITASGTPCRAAACRGDGAQAASFCNATGQCVDGATSDCGVYACDTATGACRTSCTAAADCRAGYGCVAGVCKRLAGQSCGLDAECVTGFCADGVCCASRCGGFCERCSQPGREGLCDPVPAGQDPDNECAQDAASTCRQSGACDGLRACAVYPAGTECAPAFCSGAVSFFADQCDGLGNCINGGTQTCAPFACSVASGLCQSNCTSTAQCALGYQCVSGACRSSGGQSCARDADCASGFCTDGVCCESRCGGSCEKCNAPGRLGSCDPVALGTDPDNECATDPTTSCRQSGSCNGQRACALYASGTLCVAQSCTADVTTLAARCDGSGLCLAGGTQSCAPYTCNPSTGGCRTSCAASPDCQPGYACAGGVCRKDLAATCASDADCASGFCTDGVCCSARCQGTCEKCNLAGRIGVCDPIPAGTDPESECPADNVATCGRTGFCSGNRTCALFSPGTICAAASCVGNTSIRADTCDGQGACIDNGTQTCPVSCEPATGQCRATCATDAQCTGGLVCVGGFCKKPQGVGCTSDGECASGFCTDGFCCASRCGGACEKCNFPGRVGFCDAVPAGQDPDDECATEPVSSCGRSGACSGVRACAFYSAGTQCAAPSCSNAHTANLGQTCNGSGTCQSAGTQSCVPYGCNAATGACRIGCATSTDCASGFECAFGLCKKPRGATCATDLECGSGFCTDGVCCDSRCGGTCEKCNQSGRAGFCDPVPATTDPDNECAQDPVSGCQRSGLCSGTRSCALYAAGVVCNAGSCASSTTANAADTCNGLGACIDRGTQACGNYVCDAALAGCRTSCSTNTHCQPGYRCKTSTGQCLKDDGQTCTTAGECASGACCLGICRNTLTDLSHCGGCGVRCTNGNGTTSCQNGACTPVCNTLFASCDANPQNGCETPLTTTTNCGACGVPCSRANAIASCATGACALQSCNTGFDNCDGNNANGCEVGHVAAPETCGNAENLGSICGDKSCGFLCRGSRWRTLTTRSGRTARWFRARANECSNCCSDVTSRITLTVPSGVDYDLYVYRGCGTLVGSSRNGTGQTDSVTVNQSDGCLLEDSGFDYWIEVRFFGGSSCANWTLTVDGRDC